MTTKLLHPWDFVPKKTNPMTDILFYEKDGKRIRHVDAREISKLLGEEFNEEVVFYYKKNL